MHTGCYRSRDGWDGEAVLKTVSRPLWEDSEGEMGEVKRSLFLRAIHRVAKLLMPITDSLPQTLPSLFLISLNTTSTAFWKVLEGP